MVSYTRYLFFICLLIFISCVKNQFTLEFDLEENVTDNYNVTYYATDVKGGITVQAVASVREGKCILKGATKRPTLTFVTTRKSVYPLVIYADRDEKILITGEGKDPVDWMVNGNDINKELSDWRNENKKALSSLSPDSVNMAVRDFVEVNPDNPVSTILMLCYFNREVNEREYVSLMASLQGEAKKQDWLRLVARTDQLYHAYSYPARIESVILRSEHHGVDTVWINHKNPVMMAFWQTGFNERSALVDSIKALKKEFPDSVRIIADVCLDVDSVSWKNAIRRDSLGTTKRLWAPAGVTDTTIMKLKVNSLPYYIIFNKEGVQQYRGADLSEAISEYRRLQNEKDSI
ncbi:MAG: hypothetical protein J1F16_08015 [Muribaculaceae bacterium]|nr:hypothetical protein [Muribaculaceae bacterium]